MFPGACLALALVLVMLLPRAALAAPGDEKARQGVALASRGECAKAVPLLEDAELERHRPSTAYVLAGCYVELGELVRASELYNATARERPVRGWTRDDWQAAWRAKQKGIDLDAKIPTIAFKTDGDYEGFEVEINGRPVTEPEKPRQVLPNKEIVVSARAEGMQEHEEKVVLLESERRVLVIKLEKATASAAKKSKKEKPGSKDASTSRTWIGARFRGMVIPKFLINAFGEGGKTLFIPGADVTFTTGLSDADIALSLGYSSYRMGEVPYKPRGRPDTEYEILQSDMQALILMADLSWAIPLDKAERWSFRIGGGLGIGWTFAGDVYRTQAYPPSGVEGDPYEYLKCRGPNAPPGTFRYCNQLDKDRDHYGGYAEPSWFDGGARPLVFPWLTIPQVGLSWRITPRLAIDVDAGLTLSGAMVSAGMRFRL